MEFVNLFIRILAASQVILFIGILAGSKNPVRVRVIGVTLMSAVLVFFLNPIIIQHLGVDNQVLNHFFPSLIPILTLIFVFTVFEESCEIPKWLVVLFLVDLSLLIWLSAHGNHLGPSAVAAQSVNIFAGLCAVFIVWRGRENDLVEMRSKLRLVFIAAFSVTVLGESIIRILSIFDIFLPGKILGNLWMLAITFLANFSFIKLNPSLSLVVETPKIEDPKDLSDAVIDELLRRMKDERLYADHDLRVGSLAEIVGIPEYQLRQKINQSLGYRNFNQFVNHYRIEEAGQRLQQDSRTPVLTIALDVGFRSISSFNTAFQTQFGVSPTKYRSTTPANS